MTNIPTFSPKTRLQLAVDRFEQHIQDMGKHPNPDQQRHLDIERNHIQNLAQITERLREYEGWVENASYESLLNQKHDSKRLGENMRAAGRPKPTDRYDAHAIISGIHERATASRILMATVQVGIDEHQNGAWLPRSGYDARKSNNWAMEKAVPHSRTHRKSLYAFIERRIRSKTTGEAMRYELLQIGKRLESGTLPSNILAEMRYDDLQNS